MMCKATKIRSIQYVKQNKNITFVYFYLNKAPDSLLEHLFITFLYQVELLLCFEQY